MKSLEISLTRSPGISFFTSHHCDNDITLEKYTPFSRALFLLILQLLVDLYDIIYPYFEGCFNSYNASEVTLKNMDKIESKHSYQISTSQQSVKRMHVSKCCTEQTQMHYHLRWATLPLTVTTDTRQSIILRILSVAKFWSIPIPQKGHNKYNQRQKTITVNYPSQNAPTPLQ